MLRSNSSAGPGAKIGVGTGLHHPHSLPHHSEIGAKAKNLRGTMPPCQRRIAGASLEDDQSRHATGRCWRHALPARRQLL